MWPLLGKFQCQHRGCWTGMLYVHMSHRHSSAKLPPPVWKPFGRICFPEVPVYPGWHTQLEEALIWNVLQSLKAYFELFSPNRLSPPKMTHKIIWKKIKLHSCHLVRVAQHLYLETAVPGFQGRGSMKWHQPRCREGPGRGGGAWHSMPEEWFSKADAGVREFSNLLWWLIFPEMPAKWVSVN